MMNLIAKTVAKNTAWLLAGNIVNKLLSFLIVVFLARRLGDSGFGKFSFAQSLVQILVVFADLGLGFLVIREVARDKGSSGILIGRALSIRLVFSFVIFLIAAVVIGLVDYDSEARFLVYFLGLYSIFVSFYALICSVFMGFEKMGYNVGISFIEKALILLFCVFLLRGNSAELQMLGLIYAGGGFLALVLAFAVLRAVFNIRPVLDMSLRSFSSLLKKSYPIAIGSILVSIYCYSNTVILSKTSGYQAAGWYSGAFFLAFYTQFIPGAFLGSIFPVMSRLSQDSKDSLKAVYQKSFEIIIAFAAFVSLAGFILADKIILSFYGPDYFNSILIFKILIFGSVFYCSISFFGHFLVSSDEQKLAANISALAVIVNLVLLFIFIPVYGYNGAALAIVISSFAAFVLSLAYLSRLGYCFRWFTPLKKIGLAVIAALSALLAVKALNFIIAVFIALAVYLEVLRLSRFFHFKNKPF